MHVVLEEKPPGVGLEAQLATARRRIVALERELQERGTRDQHDAIAALAKALLERDRYTGDHSAALVRLAAVVARGLGLDEADLDCVRSAALLHDYPDGLAGDDIPICSRIVLACDAYHAMTSDRPYRAAMSHAEAIEEISRCAGTQFDPQVSTILIRSFAGTSPLRPRTVRRRQVAALHLRRVAN